jgi:hypothetical protein
MTGHAAHMLWLAWFACLPDEEPFTPDLVEHPVDYDVMPIDEGWAAPFEAGKAEFGQWHLERDGIGPCWIQLSCAGCHNEGGRGNFNVEKFVVLDADGLPVPEATPYGNTTRPNPAGGARRGTAARVLGPATHLAQ